MSQTYDPNSPEHGPEYGQGYASGPGWAGYASAPPPPPRRNHKRGLILTGAVALAAGAATGGLIGSMHGVTASTMTAASRTPLSASQIAQRVDPALVDVVSTEGDQGATAAGTGIVLTSNGEVLTNNHVIRGATSIKVTDVGNGRTYTAKVVGYDATKDVAVIQLQNASGLTTANLGDSSSVQSGDSVTALGNAGGKGGTPSVATGTVTALNLGIETDGTSSGSGSGGGSGDSGGFGGFGGFGSGFGGFGSQGDGSGTNGSGTSSGLTIAGALSGSPAANAGLVAGDTITSVAGQ